MHVEVVMLCCFLLKGTQLNSLRLSGPDGLQLLPNLGCHEGVPCYGMLQRSVYKEVY